MLNEMLGICVCINEILLYVPIFQNFFVGMPMCYLLLSILFVSCWLLKLCIVSGVLFRCSAYVFVYVNGWSAWP
jgi:hypothetical protein